MPVQDGMKNLILLISSLDETILFLLKEGNEIGLDINLQTTRQ